uniref:Putative ovule protein n=1 Tax=Solanum chacoense TaxID=4108 RepID=A0A0V0GJQ2_SOLCH
MDASSCYHFSYLASKYMEMQNLYVIYVTYLEHITCFVISFLMTLNFISYTILALFDLDSMP